MRKPGPPRNDDHDEAGAPAVDAPTVEVGDDRRGDLASEDPTVLPEDLRGLGAPRREGAASAEGSASEAEARGPARSDAPPTSSSPHGPAPQPRRRTSAWGPHRPTAGGPAGASQVPDTVVRPPRSTGPRLAALRLARRPFLLGCACALLTCAALELFAGVQIGLSRLILESARALQGFSSDVPVVRHDSSPSSDAPAGERRAAVELRRRLRARVGDDCFGARIPPVIVELDDALLHGRRWAEAVARARERAQDAASACGRELPEVAPPPSESAR